MSPWLPLLASLPALAQDPPPPSTDAYPIDSPAAETGATPMSLEDAFRVAQLEAETIVIAEAAVRRAKGDTFIAASGFLPSLNLSAGYTRTFASEFEDAFAVPTGVPTGTGVPGVDLSDLPFGQENAWRVDFLLSQPIFNGGRAYAQAKIAGAQSDLADLGVTSAKASLALDVTKAYYDAALADRLVEIAKDTLTQSEATQAETRLSAEVGVVPEYDLLRATVAVENQRVNLVRREWLRETAHLRLRQLLDLPPDAPLDLTSRVDVDVEPVSVAETAAAAAGVSDSESTERFPVQQAEAGVTISRNARAIARSQWFPSINASASYGWTSYPNGVFPEIDPDRWNRNVSAGVQMTLPIFNGGRILGSMEKAGADVTQAEARQQQAVELTDLDTRDANLQLDASRAQWVATSGTVDQARRAYEISEIRYREGVSTQLELADSRLLLAVALANRAQAARDLQVARIRVALLPVLPVQLGTTAAAVNAELGAGGATNF